MFSKNKKIILIVGIIVVLFFGTARFFILKQEKKTEKIKVEKEKQESHFLTKEEKENFGIDSNLEIKMRQVQGDLGLINVIEFPK